MKRTILAFGIAAMIASATAQAIEIRSSSKSYLAKIVEVCIRNNLYVVVSSRGTGGTILSTAIAQVYEKNSDTRFPPQPKKC